LRSSAKQLTRCQKPPEGSKESDVLNITIERDQQATSQARERTSSLMERLKKKSQGKTGIIRDPETGRQ